MPGAGCRGDQSYPAARRQLLAPYEWVYAVPGLSVVGSSGDAVTLFLERTTAARGGPILDQDRVAELCGGLDGVALAIELAAARYPSLGLDGLLAGLARGLRVLSSGGRDGDRHSSMRDTLAWSFDLLEVSDRALLCAVAVFASWFDREAASAVAGESPDPGRVADGLGRLAEHNLLVAVPGEPTGACRPTGGVEPGQYRLHPGNGAWAAR